MPVISNATVATGTGLSTNNNGSRKIIRLQNGALVSANRFSASSWQLYKSTDNGTTWSQIVTVTETVNDIALSSKGNDIHVLIAFSQTTVKHYRYNDSGVLQGAAQNVDVTQTAMGTVSLAINEAGTELHAAWSAKNNVYPNSFNIRYAKGTINGDGSVAWTTPEYVTTYNTSTINHENPSIVTKGAEFFIFSTYQGQRLTLLTKSFTTKDFNASSVSNIWGYKLVFDGGVYVQSSPSSIFVPIAINGLANGRIWVAWHGKDATDSAKFNVRVSYSDDGGVTWATPVKLTSGNLYDRQNVSLAADKTGKVFALYEEHQWSPDLDIYMRTFSGGSWGAPVAVAEADPAAESNPSALVDYSLQMTTPPFVFTNATDGIKFSGNFNVGASVSPASGALGNKETATLTAYTVTPEAGSTVTQIVEKVNGVTVNTFNNPASLSRTLTVPTATWDALAYFATHTASVTVTDSNGATTVTTYSFAKLLATGASLLEATKANTDAKNRVSQKRDALAAQVGLSAGATFDAISAQLASGAFYKVATGSVSSVSTVTVTGLSFTPKLVIVEAVGNTNNGRSVYWGTDDNYNMPTYRYGGLISNGNAWTITSNGFSKNMTNSGNYKWIALG